MNLLQGVDGLIEALTEAGMKPAVRNGVVVFTVVPASGSLADTIVEVGVAVTEAVNWPGVAPHWVQLPAEVKFGHTNTRPSPHPGWLGHSRNLDNWNTEADHARALVAHMRAVLGAAV